MEKKNSTTFMSKFKKWIKDSRFGLSVALVAVLFLVGITALRNPSNNLSSSDSGSSSNSGDSSGGEDGGEVDNRLDEVISNPFSDNGVSVARDFFVIEALEDENTTAVVNIEGGWYHNQGIDLTSTDDRAFGIVASFSGRVIAIYEDHFYGLEAVIEAENGLRARYTSLSDLKVTVGDEVRQGEEFATAGESLWTRDLGKHTLHFEVILKTNSKTNPKNAFGKQVKDLN